MEINNFIDAFFTTITTVILFGIGFLGGIYYLYSSLKRRVVFSKEQLLRDTFELTALQELITGILLIIFNIWFFIIEGNLLKYINAMDTYFNLDNTPFI